MLQRRGVMVRPAFPRDHRRQRARRQKRRPRMRRRQAKAAVPIWQVGKYIQTICHIRADASPSSDSNQTTSDLNKTLATIPGEDHVDDGGGVHGGTVSGAGSIGDVGNIDDKAAKAVSMALSVLRSTLTPFTGRTRTVPEGKGVRGGSS